MKAVVHIRFLAAALVAGWIATSGAALAQQVDADQSAPPVQTEITQATPGPAPEDAPTLPSELPALNAPEAGQVSISDAPAPAMSTPAAPGAGLPHDLSPWSMFEAAHWVVKAVMVSLVFACFVTWTILLFKTVELGLARRRARHSGRQIRDAASLATAAKALAGRHDPAAFMVHAALAEYLRSDDAVDIAGPEGVKERVRSILDRVDAQAIARMRRGTGLLASIGSTAPFVGLFGTVWGIMNSFIGIAASRTTNLAVVAPGIAEALLATAIGLVAAIPAVVIYNFFSREIASYRLMLGDAAAGVERLVSRDLDFRKIVRKAA